MWSRRKFILSILAGYGFWSVHRTDNTLAFYKNPAHSKLNLKLIGAEYWLPAISCNFIDFFGDNLACMADDLGKLATADILSASQHSHVYPILGETNNLGNKIFFLNVIEPQLAIAVAQKQSGKTAKDKHHKQIEQTEIQDNQFVCHLINLSSAQAPHIISTTPISNYIQIGTFAVGNIKDRPVLCLSGLDNHGDNRISIYGLKGKNKLQTLSSFKIKSTVKALVLGYETLLVLYDVPQASIFALNNIANPQLIRTVKLSDEIGPVANYDDICAWSAQKGGKCIVTIGDIEKFPEPLSSVNADGLLSIEAMAMNAKQILVLGSNEGNSAVVPFTIDKNHMLRQQEPIALAGYLENGTTPSKIVLGKDAAFISSGWAGVQALSVNHKGMWSATSCYGLQTLPVAGLASWSDYLLLSGAELQLYSLSRNSRPKLLSTTKLESTIKTIISAGSYVLCLDKIGITLRKLEKPENILVKLAIAGAHLSYDKVNHKAYLIQPDKDSQGNKGIRSDKDEQSDKDIQPNKNEQSSKNIQPENTQHKKDTDTKKKKAESVKLTELIVYNNSIQVAKTFSILEESYCSSADEGYVLVGNLDSLAIYEPAEDNELVCKREFKDLAWREIILSKGKIFATAIDQNVNGFFLTMSFDGQSISLLSSTKLPHDGVALTIKNDTAFVVGQNLEGNSLLTTIDISNENKPKIIHTKPVLQSASAITTNNGLVIVSGQGFEVFST